MVVPALERAVIKLSSHLDSLSAGVLVPDSPSKGSIAIAAAAEDLVRTLKALKEAEGLCV